MVDRAQNALSLDDLSLDGNGDANLPKYRKVYLALRAAIEKNPGSVGRSLPIERKIAEHFSVSKITVRQALDLLEQDLFIEKIHGKAARISAQQTSRTNKFRRLGTLADLLSGGLHRRTVVVDYELVQNSFAASIFSISDSERLFRLRLKHFNGLRQFGYTEAFFQHDVGERLSLKDFISDNSNLPLHVFKVVEDRLGIEVKGAQVVIGSEVDDPASPKTDPMAASLVRVQLIFSNHTGPIEVSNNWFDGSLYEVSYELAV